MTKANQSWSYSAGERGRNRVRAYEDRARGTIFLEFYETQPGTGTVRRVRVSAGHCDRTAAKRKADELAAAFSRPERPQFRQATLEVLFDMYLREVTPTKGVSKRAHDVRTAEMFRQFFGSTRKAATLNRRDWDRFIHERRRGVIRHPGQAASSNAHVVVRDRQVAYDLKFLISVLNWATLAADERGTPLLERNPFKGLPLPKEESPRRPLLSQEQYTSLLRIAGAVDPQFELALVLAHETGHRIGAVRKLRWADIDLHTNRIRWRAENDKIGLEHDPPLSNSAVEALQRARSASAAIGDALLFPSKDDERREVDRHVVQDWWRRGAKLAGISAPRLGWHSLRRKFVNELKADTPIADLCYLGGWKSPITVMTVYMQPDAETMRTALTRRENRRVVAG